ncbi:MAG: hypothetical protein IJX98_02175 [Clostridia bacterium]|nr:hypothetical protein [Clostridia bacterium]
MMKKSYEFGEGKWNLQDLRYAYSPACFDRVEFQQEKNCIVNRQGKSLFGYEYISLIDRAKWKIGTVITAKCSFEKFGAPLIVVTNDIKENEKGELVYGTHFEVVAHEGGINVWRVEPWPERVERPTRSTLLSEKKFTIEGNTNIEIKAEVQKGKIKAWVNGEYLETDIVDLPTEEFWVGITACEGINRFYSFEIEV